MRRTLALAAAGVLLAAAGPPATAEEVSEGGLSCSMTATRTEDTVVAVVSGGPWHRTPPGESTVSMTCRIEADMPGGGRMTVAEVGASAGNGVTVLPPTVLGFDVQGTASTVLHVCTEVTVHEPGRTPPYEVRRIDADNDPRNGAQCAKTHPDDSDLVYVYFVPPGSHGNGDYCAYVHHGIEETDLGHPLRPIPPPPSAVCLPV